MARERLFKVLDKNGRPCHGGKGKWHLPHRNRPGKWMPGIDTVIPCVSGYHLCRAKDLFTWVGPTIHEAEGRGKRIVCRDKIVVAQARLTRVLAWDDSLARLFACDCAARAIAKTVSPAAVSIEAVIVARRYARGRATQAEFAAAWDAAAGAAWAGAAAAADAAEAAACAAWDTACAAWGAAAAAGVAWGAAGYSARAAERRWQTKRLLRYLDGKPMRDIRLPVLDAEPTSG